MAKATFTEISGLPDAMPSEHFELMFGDIPGSDFRAGEVLSLACQSAALPGVDNEMMQISLHGFDFVFSGKATFSKTLALTISERVRGMPVYTALMNWAQMVRGFETGMASGFIEDYSRNVELHIYDGVNRNVPTKVVVFERLFPTSIPDTTLDGTGSAPMMISPVFSFTRVYPRDMALR